MEGGCGRARLLTGQALKVELHQKPLVPAKGQTEGLPLPTLLYWTLEDPVLPHKTLPFLSSQESGRITLSFIPSHSVDARRREGRVC